MRAVLRVALAATVLLAAAAAAGAELAILTNGHRYKVTEWEVQHSGQAVGTERIRLSLEGGGTVTLPLMQVERIVDDEIVEEPPPDSPAEPGFTFDYRPGQTAPSTPYGELFLEVGREHELNPDLLAAPGEGGVELRRGRRVQQGRPGPAPVDAGDRRTVRRVAA